MCFGQKYNESAFSLPFKKKVPLILIHRLMMWSWEIIKSDFWENEGTATGNSIKLLVYGVRAIPR